MTFDAVLRWADGDVTHVELTCPHSQLPSELFIARDPAVQSMTLAMEGGEPVDPKSARRLVFARRTPHGAWVYVEEARP